MGNRLKRVFPKFEVCASYFGRVNGRSKFAVVQSAAHKNKWAAATSVCVEENFVCVNMDECAFAHVLGV